MISCLDRRVPRIGAAVACSFVAALLASPALSSDGVLEIGHACATSASGCFPGDGAGYPVQIAQSGSYALTSDLTAGAVTAIDVSASNVSIDLKGFSIRGTWTSGGCAAVPVGFGVYAPNSAASVVVSNGSVSRMHSQGVSLDGPGARIERVVSQANCSTGLWVGTGGLVVEGQAHSNGGHGIVANAGSVVTRSVANDNILAGVFAFENTQLSNVVVQGNDSWGIFADAGSSISDCTAYGNQNGIGGSALVTASNARNNALNGIIAYAVGGSSTFNNPSGGILTVHRIACNIENGTRVCP